MNKILLAITALTIVSSSGSLVTTARAAEEATVQGSLGKDQIRPVIQQHIGEVKQCYEAQLQKNKSLAGRVMVNFTIGTDGKVTDSRISETTLKNPDCEKCIADAVQSWQFPKPRGGKVVVNYPFVLAP